MTRYFNLSDDNFDSIEVFAYNTNTEIYQFDFSSPEHTNFCKKIEAAMIYSIENTGNYEIKTFEVEEVIFDKQYYKWQFETVINKGTDEQSHDTFWIESTSVTVIEPDEQPLGSAWDFVEKYYPNYSNCNDILFNSDLAVQLDEAQAEGKPSDLIYSLQVSFKVSSSDIYEKAIQVFINQTKGDQSND